MSLELSGTTGVKGVAGSVSAPSIVGDDTNTGISFPAADTIKFSTGGVERMSITNSGVTGGGKIIQVKSVSKTDTFSSNTAGAQDITGLSITMDAPASVNSRYFVIASLSGAADNSGFCFLLNGTTTGQLLTPSSTSSRIAGMGGELYHDRTDMSHYHTLSVVDDPDTTATQTYKAQIFIRSGYTGFVNRTRDDSDSVGRIRPSSTLTVFEVQ